MASTRTRIAAVECTPAAPGWTCSVMLIDDAGSSVHEVTVGADALARFARGAVEPSLLVRTSFEFLLERERRGSILRQFELPVIERYFPEYPQAIAQAMRGARP